jgi:hypothetical protein
MRVARIESQHFNALTSMPNASSYLSGSRCSTQSRNEAGAGDPAESQLSNSASGNERWRLGGTRKFWR